MAFLRYFPGHSVLESKATGAGQEIWPNLASDFIRSETRHFARLTPLATWRSEYLFRTRLIRNLARGKPGTSSGNIGSSSRSSQSGKKGSAVLTYNSKLPWVVTSLHAAFSNGKKPPRALQGAADLGVATMSDPTTGKIEKWGLEDGSSFSQLDEVIPNLVPYGLAEGPAATSNVMDVSQPYGMLAGEGFPGGRAYFRSTVEGSGRYLGQETSVVDTYPDIPRIPEMSEAICSVWLAKSSAVPSTSQSMIGMLSGSTLGVVTAYSLGGDSGSTRFSVGDMTARWVLSPGVPIISLKVDEQYSIKRKAASRIWAVALNALGEVFYLTNVPTANQELVKGEDITKNAWYAGRTVYWHLLESTRRVARPDDQDKNALRGAYSPRSPVNSMQLSKEQLVAEAREVEKFLRQRPSHFRKVCEGWDMQRRLEVDFAADDGNGAGETIFVVDCGRAEGQPAAIRRHTRAIASLDTSIEDLATTSQTPLAASVFGAASDENPASDSRDGSPTRSPATPLTPSYPASPMHDWRLSNMNMKKQAHAIITATALDCSTQSVLTLSEDALHTAGELLAAASGTKAEQSVAEIPGRRARYFAVGTKHGSVIAWDGRGDEDKSLEVAPLRILQTESPEISCVAMTALYLVHGGSDGLVQAWDPLGSVLDPIRTLNARSNGRVPRHMLTMNPALSSENYCAAGAIYLDPDSTVLRGVVSFGSFLRYWAYSSHGHPAGRKRRLRYSDVNGRGHSRRIGGAVTGFIAAEEAELRRENELRAREQTRLHKRFGLGALGDLTEEEAIRYAQMVSEEAYLLDEQRRTSDSAPDTGLDTASSFSETTVDTITPEPSVIEAEQPQPSILTEDEDEYEQQIQQAIRLSLLEGVNDLGQSPGRSNSSGEYEFSVKYKAKGGKKGRGSGASSPLSSHTPMNMPKAGPSMPQPEEDEDLALALSLSMADQEKASGNDPQADYFPPLESTGAGKGKGVQRW